MGLEENIFRGINVCGMANDFFSLFPMFEIYQEYPNLEVTFWGFWLDLLQNAKN